MTPAEDKGAPDQAAVIAFLAGPAAHGGHTPEHVETHLSHIFLGPEFALKLKKAIQWSVVDYASLEAREAFCQRELAVNRPNAPEIYLDVLPVTQGPDGLALDGGGQVVDHVLRMRRFAEEGQLDNVVEAGGFTPALAEATADVIAALHRRAPVVRRSDHLSHVRSLATQLTTDTAAELGGEAATAVEAVARACERVLDAVGPTVDVRARHGFVRRCHGDLHLSNLCLWEGAPVAFDAIEFSEEIATIDVMYDLAFVLIDLEHRGHAGHAALLASRYLSRTRDYRALALAPLYKALRHMVRALVGAKKGRDVSAHLAAARQLLEAPRRPALVAIGGLSGSGKTTVARALCAATGAVIVRADVTRKGLFGVEPETRLPPDAYAREVSTRVYRRMAVDARRALAAGATVILDATFLAPHERAAARTLAGAMDVPFAGIWLDASPEALAARVRARTGDASDADVAVLEKQVGWQAGEMDFARLDALREPQDLAADIARMIAPGEAPDSA